ncbi:MAG: hypothetical protein WAK69_08380, partial [Rhodoplanes sp.]
MPKCSRKSWTTGMSRVTSAVFPGHKKEANGRSMLVATRDLAALYSARSVTGSRSAPNIGETI